MLVDIRLGNDDGFELFAHCRKKQPAAAVMMITGYGTVESAVEAIRLGAFDFLTKPLIDEELQMAIQRALDQQKVIEENRTLKAQLDLRFGMENIVGHDHRMLKIYDMIDSVADTRATVLITGESGTGKSMIARAIHRRSAAATSPSSRSPAGRCRKRCWKANSSATSPGRSPAPPARSSASSCGRRRHDLPRRNHHRQPGMQVKLLRVLQDLEFEQVGGSKTFRVDTRVILATNDDLGRMVAEGRFRQDLFYRINVINVELPPLRERIADIPLLAEHFLRAGLRRLPARHVRGFTDEAMAALQRYRWPGNVRELQNVIERAVLLGKGEMIGLDDLPGRPGRRTGQPSSRSATAR